MIEPLTVKPEEARIRRWTHRRGRLLSNYNPVVVVAAVATLLSVASFLYFFANEMTNVYGDGVAHVNIARKVVDSEEASLRQRYMQIGSPWLPLQTVLMLPLVANDWLWRTGVAGSIVSMISFVIAAVSLYLLAASVYRNENEQLRRILPRLSASILVFNPSALYMQSTPMTEMVFMAALITAVYLLQRWLNERISRRLVFAASAMTVATLARYEAWPVAALAVAIVALNSRGNWKARLKTSALFSLITSTGPIYWLWHNWAIYGNALEFLTGPNSARGIYLQNRANLGWSAIFVGHATLDVLTVATAVAVCAGPLVLLLGAVGFFRWLAARRKALLVDSAVLLLLAPFFFHVFSMYRGEIQVFPLSAFGLHNVRYGVPHLLAVAVFAPGALLLFKRLGWRRCVAITCVAVAAQYVFLISDGPAQLAVYQEAYRNGVNARPARERAGIASFLRANPPVGLIVMHTGALGPVVSQGGLRFSNIIHEGSSRWHQLGEGFPRDVE
ncbi:MAG: hypothetical protein WAV20_12765, partial [Blastocatellia bacterium]